MPEKNDDFAKIGEKLEERGVLPHKDIKLTSCILLSNQKHYYRNEWNGVIHDISFIERLHTFVFNGSDMVYDVWGLARADGAYFDKFLLLSNDQGIVLYEDFYDESKGTVVVPPYTPDDIRDLSSIKNLGGGKLMLKMGHEADQYAPLLAYCHAFGL